MDNLKDLPVVYIDETGIDRYLYRPYARTLRGEKVYEKISGRRFERTSIVAGQVDGEFIAPMIYKESMTSDFFVKWFKTELLPALKTPHVIVMDNASFHPKSILDELCIQDKHFFLPLPPYSPDLNPIKQAWAVLKKKVTDLLREVPNIFECLERFLKLNNYKTELAKTMSEYFNGKLTRIQFSMMQTEEAYKYIFGDAHSKGSLAKDLLSRETNIVLIDEFDKVNSSLYNVFIKCLMKGSWKI